MKTQWVDLFPKRILILHSDRMISNLLSYGLISQGFIVHESIARISEVRLPIFDLVILDAALKRKEVQALKQEWSKLGTPPVLEIICTPLPTLEDKSLSKYIVDQIEPPIDFPELIDKINSIIQRNIIGLQQLQVSSHNKAFRIKDIEIYPERFEIKKKNTVLSLRKVELNIFIHLVQHIGMFVTVNQMQEMFKVDTEMVYRTIQNHILKLREKLDIFQGEIEIQTTRNKGYRLMVYSGEGS
ncbi:winged helix-turn-helix domain-containing protein [Paenibacillus sp. FSL L8-0696]|uniref:response regulator transcription factor n=1 Tax=Paenibacillus sp. FSL L8-0696 TaxID=2954524 RepID=UPI00311920CE